MQCHARNKPYQVNVAGVNAVVVAGRVHDPFGHAEADATGQPPHDGRPPREGSVIAAANDDGEGLGKFLAQSDADRKSEEAKQKAVFGIAGGVVAEADQLHDVENHGDDRGPASRFPGTPRRETGPKAKRRCPPWPYTTRQGRSTLASPGRLRMPGRSTPRRRRPTAAHTANEPTSSGQGAPLEMSPGSSRRASPRRLRLRQPRRKARDATRSCGDAAPRSSLTPIIDQAKGTSATAKSKYK